jgi:hypothetical protein
MKALNHIFGRMCQIGLTPTENISCKKVTQYISKVVKTWLHNLSDKFADLRESIHIGYSDKMVSYAWIVNY